MDFSVWDLPQAIKSKLKGRKPFILHIDRRIDMDYICGKLRTLQEINRDQALILVINSGGGNIKAGELLISHLKMLKVPIFALAVGKVASMALRIYLHVPKENRFALAGSVFMTHFATGHPGVSGQIDLSEKISGMSEEDAIKIFRIAWKHSKKLSKNILEFLKSEFGETVTIDGVEISVKHWLALEQWFPDVVAKKIGIVHQIV